MVRFQILPPIIVRRHPIVPGDRVTTRLQVQVLGRITHLVGLPYVNIAQMQRAFGRKLLVRLPGRCNLPLLLRVVDDKSSRIRAVVVGVGPRRPMLLLPRPPPRFFVWDHHL